MLNFDHAGTGILDSLAADSPERRNGFFRIDAPAIFSVFPATCSIAVPFHRDFCSRPPSAAEMLDVATAVAQQVATFLLIIR
jgi:hypothetical protein